MGSILRFVVFSFIGLISVQLFSQEDTSKDPFEITFGYGPSMTTPHRNLTHNLFLELPVVRFSTAALTSEFAYFSGTGSEITSVSDPELRLFNSTDIDQILAGLKARFVLLTRNKFSLNAYLGLSASYGNLTNTTVTSSSTETSVTISSERGVMSTVRSFQIDFAISTKSIDFHLRPYIYFLNPSHQNIGVFFAVSI